jgi:4-amino-4-deoxy-L-arabinose transferase-like glycosyltransferase
MATNFIERYSLWFLITLQILVWGAIAPALHTALPLDVAELMTLSGEGVIANYKHPNLPGLLLDLFIGITGKVEVVYFLSQLSIVVAYLAIYLLSREFLSKQKALVATFLTSSIFYYHWPTPEFNHNVLQIPLWAAATLFAWRAVTTQKIMNWLALGMVAGAMVWTKYSAGILLLWVFIWLLMTPCGRRSFKGIGPWLTASLFLLIAWPQASYLIDSEFLPIHYAQDRASSGGIADSISFLGAQLADHLFYIILLIVGGLIGRGALVAKASHASDKTTFLWLVVIAPVVMVALLPVIAGMGLKPMWGTPMFNFSGLVLLYFLGGRLTDARARRVKLGALLLIPLVGVLYATQHIYRADMSDKPMRTLWPQAEIAGELRTAYQAETGLPLKIVAATDWLGGLIASSGGEQLRVRIDADLVKSPWVTDKDISEDGVLVAWLAGQALPASMNDFIESKGFTALDAKRRSFIWHPSKADKPIQIEYIAISPSFNK